MHCTQFEALKTCCQAWRDQGIESDKSTVDDNNVDENAEDEAEDPQEDLALVKTRIRKDTVDMFIYNDQMITTLDVL
jgi:hypothetical protein